MRKWIPAIIILAVLGYPAAANANTAPTMRPMAVTSRVATPAIGIPPNTNDVLNVTSKCKPGDALTVTFYFGGISKLAGGPLTISYPGVLKDTRTGAIMNSSADHEECDDFMGCAATVKLVPVALPGVDIPAPYGQILFLVAVGPQDARKDSLINHSNWH